MSFTQLAVLDADVNGPWHVDKETGQSWLIERIPWEIAEVIHEGDEVILYTPDNERRPQLGGTGNRAILMEKVTTRADADGHIGYFRIKNKWIYASELTVGDLGRTVSSQIYRDGKKGSKALGVQEYEIKSIYADRNGRILINGTAGDYLRLDTELEFLD